MLLKPVSKSQQLPEPTHPIVKYGPDKMNYLTAWLPESDEPLPVVLFMGGGGFREGDESHTPRPRGLTKDIHRLVPSGIAVVGIRHRVPSQVVAPAPFEDVARALQFVRSKAEEWNLDTGRIASTGTSSGGCISLWLAFHKDLAKPRRKDPIARLSTRLACVAVNQAPTSVDPRFVQKLMPGFDVGRTNLPRLHGISMEDLDRLPKTTYRAMEESSPINHVSEDAPPTLLRYNNKRSARYTIHHAEFGFALKERMDKVNARCDLIAGGEAVGNSEKKTIVGFIKAEFAKVKLASV
jgi:acetyl esterase/lipase